jgi:hypothetical protein
MGVPGTAGGRGRESGSALAAVIALLAITGIIGASLLAATMFATGYSTAGRASVQAQAAAEGGIDAVTAAVMTSGSCVSGTYASAAGTTPQYTVQVLYRVQSGNWLPGCPHPQSTEVRLVSTGRADARGVDGQTSGDTATMEATFAVVPPQPEFNRAAYGDKALVTHAAFKVIGTSGVPDMVTNGNMTCRAQMDHGGSLYVGGDFHIAAQCGTQGPVFVRGNLLCEAAMTITGDLYVAGNVNLRHTSCHVTGRLWIGGDLQLQAVPEVDGDLWVKGSIVDAQIPVVGGAVRVGGTMPAATKTAYTGRVTQPDGALTAPPGLPGYDPAAPANAFPKLKVVDDHWTGMTARTWSDATQAVRGSGSVCAIGSWPTTTSLVIDVPTKLDSTGNCPSGLTMNGGGLSIVLKADLVLLANMWDQVGGTVKVTSGDGEEHSLYLVQPWGTSQTACSTTSGTGFYYAGGSWTQPDAKTRIMLYTAKGLDSRAAIAIRGQVYACNFSESALMTITYQPVTSQSPSAPAATLQLTSKRDVTG